MTEKDQGKEKKETFLVVLQLRICLAMQGMQVQYLGGELRSHMLQSAAKKNKQKQNKKNTEKLNLEETGTIKGAENTLKQNKTNHNL